MQDGSVAEQSTAMCRGMPIKHNDTLQTSFDLQLKKVRICKAMVNIAMHDTRWQRTAKPRSCVFARPPGTPAGWRPPSRRRLH